MADTASTNSSSSSTTTPPTTPATAGASSVPHSAAGEVESPLHESSNIPLRALIYSLIIFVVGTAGVHWVIYEVFDTFRGAAAQPREITGVAAEHLAPPEPRLQPSIAHNELPSMDLDRLRATEREEFARRGWIDEQTGQIRVPQTIVNQLAQMSRTKK